MIGESPTAAEELRTVQSGLRFRSLVKELLASSERTGTQNSAFRKKSVRQKLPAAPYLLEKLTPHSPKLLLCGMADSVNEIAARLVKFGAGPERRFANWSVVGLLPMPEQALTKVRNYDPG